MLESPFSVFPNFPGRYNNTIDFSTVDDNDDRDRYPDEHFLQEFADNDGVKNSNFRLLSGFFVFVICDAIIALARSGLLMASVCAISMRSFSARRRLSISIAPDHTS